MMTAENEQPDDAPSADLYSWQVTVTGRVQGVGYRYFTQLLAQELGVTGWVRNASDGSVQALLQHADTAVLSRMVVMLKHGPPHGWVDDCSVTPLAGIAPYEAFHIRG